jgi:hypothetical protein
LSVLGACESLVLAQPDDILFSRLVGPMLGISMNFPLGLLLSHLVRNGLLLPAERAIEFIHGVQCGTYAYKYLGLAYVVDDVALVHVLEDMRKGNTLPSLSLLPMNPLHLRENLKPPPPPPSLGQSRGPVLHPSLSHLATSKVNVSVQRSARVKKSQSKNLLPRNWALELTEDNPVSKLHEYCTWRGVPVPEWQPRVAKSSENSPTLFGMQCTIEGHIVTSASIRSRKQQAKNDAARLAFYTLGLIEMSDEDVLFLTNGPSLPSNDSTIAMKEDHVNFVQRESSSISKLESAIPRSTGKLGSGDSAKVVPLAIDQDNKWAFSILAPSKRTSVRSVLNLVYQKFNIGKLGFTVHDVWIEGIQAPYYLAEIHVERLNISVQGRWAYHKKDSSKEQVAAEVLLRVLDELGYPVEKNPESRASWPLVHHSLRQIIVEWNKSSELDVKPLESHAASSTIQKIYQESNLRTNEFSICNRENSAQMPKPEYSAVQKVPSTCFSLRSPALRLPQPCPSITIPRKTAPTLSVSLKSPPSSSIFPIARAASLKQSTLGNGSSSSVTRWGA